MGRGVIVRVPTNHIISQPLFHFHPAFGYRRFSLTLFIKRELIYKSHAIMFFSVTLFIKRELTYKSHEIMFFSVTLLIKRELI